MIGTSKTTDIIPNAIAELILNNVELIHLDISFNKFNLRATKIISDALLKNHHLFGFHYEGNFGYTDY